MEVNINGDLIDIKGDFINLRDIIEKLMEIANDNRRLITSISIDDEPFDQADETSLDLPYRGQNIYVITEETDKVLEKSVEEGIKHIRESLLAGVKEVAMEFREGSIPEASKQLSILVDSFYWLLDLVDFLAKHGIFNDTDIKLNDFQISDFVSFLKEMMDSQESRDFVLVSDLLEYEIYPLLEKWLELFGHVKEIV